jgi:hypothetical protein
MKWIAFAVFAALTIVLLWRFRIIQDIGGTFDSWMKYIGYGGHRGPW